MKNEYTEVFPEIAKTIDGLNPDTILTERKNELDLLVNYLVEKQNDAIRLNFICTHNSRRSHLAQIWAQAIAHQMGFSNLSCYSGGTEVTALFPAVVESLAQTGFRVRQLSQEKNPVYSISFADNEHPILGFSKTFDDDFNPASGFAAVMTCSSASEACPHVPGAERRFALPYDDPKAYDGTPQQAEKYGERSLQIATELRYVFERFMDVKRHT